MICKETLSKRSFYNLRQMIDFMLRYVSGDRTEEQQREALGFPALLSIVSAVGLGFLINDAILLPLLVVFLVITVVGLISGRRHHGKPWALIVGVLSSLVILGFLFVYPFQPGARPGRHRRAHPDQSAPISG